MRHANRKFMKPRLGKTSMLAMAFVFVLQLYVPGAAICLEDDGDAFIENYLRGDCADTFTYPRAEDNDSQSPNGENYYGDRHCGSCLDIPLSEKLTQKDALSRNDVDLEIGIHMFAAYISPVSLYTKTSHKIVYTEATPRSSAPLSLIQTVILIC